LTIDELVDKSVDKSRLSQEKNEKTIQNAQKIIVFLAISSIEKGGHIY
jgi:hypothetical protein